MRLSWQWPKRRTWARIAVAVGIGAIAALYQVRLSFLMPHFGTDFDPIRLGARLLWKGESPYQIGPGERYFWNFPLLYPLPAVLMAALLNGVNLIAERATFVFVGASTLAYVCTRRHWWPLLAFSSASFLHAASFAQWSPLLLAAWYVPALGFVLMAKPNVGSAVIAGAESRKALAVAVAGCAIILTASFIVRPMWLGEWLGSIRGQEHIRPFVLSWLGAPLLLAALRWRRPEARLLLALAVLPQNPTIYDALLLFTVAETLRQALMLATLSWFVEPLHDTFHPGATFASGAHAWGMALLMLMYLPALVMVLRRPNVVREPT
jgi:hypothetical protein